MNRGRIGRKYFTAVSVTLKYGVWWLSGTKNIQMEYFNTIPVGN